MIAPVTPSSGHLNNVTGEGVEHASFIEQPVHCIGGGGVKLAEHDHGMAEQLGQRRTGVRAHGADLGQRQRRHIEHDPVFVVNPSCEQLILARDGGTWRNATLDDFAILGLVPPAGTIPPTGRGLRSQLTTNQLHVTAEIPNRDHHWQLRAPKHVRRQISRHAGLAVAVTTKALPPRMDIPDLPPAFNDPESLVGWAQLIRR